MFSSEQKRKVIETYIRFDHGAADTVRELGYPNRHTLRLWWKDYEKRGDAALQAEYRAKPKYTGEQMREAVGYYLEHGRSLARTRRRLGYPASNATLAKWVDELAPGERRRRTAPAPSPRLTLSEK